MHQDSSVTRLSSSRKDRSLMVVERSKTLCYVLRKVFFPSRYKLEMVDNFTFANDRLRREGSDGFDGIVLGWPIGSQEASDEFLQLLESAKFADLFVLVLNHDNFPAVRTWVAKRANTGYLLWSNHLDIVAVLDRSLGAKPKPASSGNSANPQLVARSQDIRILFVDDSPSSRVFFRRLLIAKGYKVDTASCEEDAWEKIQHHNYDIAIIDYYLADTTGDELCRRLKNNPNTAETTCAIITSAYSDHIIKDCLDAGAVECMFKRESGELFLAQVDAIARTIRGSKFIYEKTQLLEGILSAVGDGVYGIDPSGNIAFINKTALRLLGYSQGDNLVGQSAEIIYKEFKPRDRRQEGKEASGRAIDQNEQNEFLTPVDRVFWRKDGRLILVSSHVYPLRIQERDAGRVVAFQENAKKQNIEDHLWWYATHDITTKLLNRRYFEVQLETELHRLRRTDSSSALVLLVVDAAPFAVDPGDRQSGNAGSYERPGIAGETNTEGFSECLEIAGNLLVSRTRTSDLLAHLGDGRFAIVLRDIDKTSLKEIRGMFEEILNKLPKFNTSDTLSMQISVGILLMDKTILKPEEALAKVRLTQQQACHKGSRNIQIHGANEFNDQKEGIVA